MHKSTIESEKVYLIFCKLWVISNKVKNWSCNVPYKTVWGKKALLYIVHLFNFVFSVHFSKALFPFATSIKNKTCLTNTIWCYTEKNATLNKWLMSVPLVLLHLKHFINGCNLGRAYWIELTSIVFYCSHRNLYRAYILTLLILWSSEYGWIFYCSAANMILMFIIIYHITLLMHKYTNRIYLQLNQNEWGQWDNYNYFWLWTPAHWICNDMEIKCRLSGLIWRYFHIYRVIHVVIAAI